MREYPPDGAPNREAGQMGQRWCVSRDTDRTSETTSARRPRDYLITAHTRDIEHREQIIDAKAHQHRAARRLQPQRSGSWTRGLALPTAHVPGHVCLGDELAGLVVQVHVNAEVAAAVLQELLIKGSAL